MSTVQDDGESDQPVLMTSTNFEAIFSSTWTTSSPVLTVASLTSGEINVGLNIRGNGIAAGTTITALGSGTGGVGTYTMSQTQASAGSGVTVTAYLTGLGDVGTYKMSTMQGGSAASKRLITATATVNGVVTNIATFVGSWYGSGTLSEILTVDLMRQDAYSSTKQRAGGAWDAGLRHACVCDSSWPVG
jgi:hypothetical protein